jgi:tetraacyldisaccharide 4'-kinase
VSRRAESRAGEQFGLSIISGERQGVVWDGLRVVLSGCARTYQGGLGAYLAMEGLGLRKRTTLPVPTISIGNVTSGGTGKTPVTLWLTERLIADGFRPVILSRGHGGRLARHGAQVSNGKGDILVDATDAGDEASALARLAPLAPVFIGKDRRVSGRAALATVPADLFVLDDGLQYWQLARDLDIVLVDARRPFDNGKLLPAGLLREPKENLSRAGIVMVTRADRATPGQLAQTIDAVKSLAPTAHVYVAKHVFAGLRPVTEAAKDAEFSGPAVVMAGIAQPDSFREMLVESGLSIAPGIVALADHAAFDAAVAKVVSAEMRRYNARSVITTEKDAVKIGAQFDGLAVYSAQLTIEVDRPGDLVSNVLRLSGLTRTGAIAV